MAAEVKRLVEQGIGKELDIISEIGALDLCGDFEFFPSPELVEVCKKEADVLSRSYPEPGTGNLSGENFEKFKAAVGIAERFTVVYSSPVRFVRADSGKKFLAKETALVLSKPFYCPSCAQLVWFNNSVWRADVATSLTSDVKNGDLLAHGLDISKVLEGMKDLKELTTKARELFPVSPKG